MMGGLESVRGSGVPPEGGRLPEGWAGGTVTASVLGTVGELGPSILRARPEQMVGSKTRMQGKAKSEHGATSPVEVAGLNPWHSALPTEGGGDELHVRWS